MRLVLMTVGLLLCTLTARADDAEAKKLYKAYVDQVHDAKTLKIVYRQETTIQKQSQTVDGTILVGEGNRMRWEQTGFDEFLLVSDNKNWALSSLHRGDSKPGPIPEHARRALLRQLVPSMVSLELALTQIGIEKDMVPPLDITELTSKGVEKVGEREATLLTYKYGHSVLGQTPIKLWLDKKTGLPIKRQVGEELVETFTEYTINPKIEGDPFKVQEVADRAATAKKLLLDMEAKVQKAKAFKVEFASDLGKDNPHSVKGTVIVAEGGKARFEFVRTDGKKMKTELLICDGKKCFGKGGEFDTEGASVDLPKDFLKPIVPLISRGGVMLTYDTPGRGEPGNFTLDEVMPLYGFALGGKEKIGDREAQVVRFASEIRDSITVAVWIDTKTGLPLKRTTHWNRTNGETLTEIYSTFAVDPQLDDKLFELPKK